MALANDNDIKSSGFNRNIVECKLGKFSYVNIESKDLIET